MKHIEHLDKRSGVYEITPQVAQELLNNEETKNRPASGSKISIYAMQMRRDQWKVNGEPVLLSKTGALLDGQHRCLACIQADKPFRSVILYGDFPFKTLGVGKARSASDVLGIAGVPNFVAMASIARICILHGRAMQREANPVSTGGAASMLDPWKIVTNEDIDRWMSKNPESIELYQKTRSAAGKFSLIPSSPVAAVWFLSLKVVPGAETNAWYEGLITGSGLMKGDVRLLLRRAYEGYRSSSKRVVLTTMQTVADICKTWSLRDRKDLKIFKRPTTEAFQFIR